mgnify:CR=1 FL=1
MTPLDALYIPLAIVTLPWWAFKRRSGWAEKLGRVTPLPAPGMKPRILLHAVSVGEVSALRGIVPLLLPHAEVVVSVTTDTGTARAKDLFSPTCTIVRYPLDFSWSVRRFLDAVRPDCVALVELEVWPQFVRTCAARSVPACIINGRLSERSFRGYNRIRKFFGRTLNLLAFASVQDATYAKRFEALGLPPDKVLLTGSMKWDAVSLPDAPPNASESGPAQMRESIAALVSSMRSRLRSETGGVATAAAPVGTSPPKVAPSPLPRMDVAGSEELARDMGIDRTKQLIVAGSTAEDEEALLRASLPQGVQLLCAPRKPEHFDEAARAMGPSCVRRSKGKADHGNGDPARGMFLLDTIGELRKAYALADVVVMGRSFGTLHGSDPIEPISLAKPTLTGPRFGDFQMIVEALTEVSDAEGVAGLRVVSRRDIPAALDSLLKDGAVRDRMALAGQECIRRQQGSSARHAELLLALAKMNRRFS